ncbi:MAG TPA: metallophosphoesterase family protein [Methylomirabilota bacterium]|nr:metallophosphoesterase family protein [Methylomirabilota bacterium]
MPVRYGVLADVHANEPALRAVLGDLDRQGVDGLLALGDLVGYGADPGPCLEAVAERATWVVAGNHDHAAAGLLDLAWFNPHARRAAAWTADRLKADQTRYLAGLPLVVEMAGATLVHASPTEPGRWPYVVSAEEGRAALDAFRTPLCLIGHSHLPAAWVRELDGGVEHRRGPHRVGLGDGERALVSVGSVGQPRDGDPSAAYAVWDVDAGTVDLRRVPYDVREARQRIHAAGLPRLLGDRLLYGQ